MSLVRDSHHLTHLIKGVYVPADPQFPKHFHGLGMRIEDEVLVGAEHPVVLSASAPKEVSSVLSLSSTFIPHFG